MVEAQTNEGLGNLHIADLYGLTYLVTDTSIRLKTDCVIRWN